MKIKPIETQEEWIMLMINDRAKGVSNYTKDNSKDGYTHYNGSELLDYRCRDRHVGERVYGNMHRDVTCELEKHTSDFGIIEEVKIKVIKEWMYFDGSWKLAVPLMIDEVAQLYFENIEIYKETGREWIVTNE